MQVLRPYQEKAVSDVLTAYDAGAKSVVLVTGCASGKTTIASEIARRVGGRFMFVAHRRELLAQARARLAMFGVHDAIVTSVQGLLAGDVPECDFAVFDEVQTLPPENEWAKVPEELKRRGVRVLGLTATPQRADGRGLGGTFDTMLLGPSARELTEGGYISPIDVYAPPEVQKGLAMTPRAAWEHLGEGRRTIVFTRTVNEAEDEARAWGPGAIVVHGGLSADERDRRLASDWTAIFNVFLLVAGYDLPELKCAILARPCSSIVSYLQIAGRISRLHPAYATGRLIDLTGASLAHGHPAADRAYSLDGEGIKATKSAGAFCTSCGFLLSASSPMCDRCGTKRETAEQAALRVTGAKLERLEELDSHGELKRARELARWEAMGRAKGWKPNAANVKFKAVYGRWPTRTESGLALAAADHRSRGL